MFGQKDPLKIDKRRSIFVSPSCLYNLFTKKQKRLDSSDSMDRESS